MTIKCFAHLGSVQSPTFLTLSPSPQSVTWYVDPLWVMIVHSQIFLKMNEVKLCEMNQANLNQTRLEASEYWPTWMKIFWNFRKFCSVPVISVKSKGKNRLHEAASERPRIRIQPLQLLDKVATLWNCCCFESQRAASQSLVSKSMNCHKGAACDELTQSMSWDLMRLFVSFTGFKIGGWSSSV